MEEDCGLFFVQVEIANKIFTVENKAIIRANHIKQAFEQSAQNSENGFMDNKYGFIDEPVYRDALLLLSK